MPWVRRLEPGDRPWAGEVLTRSWRSTKVVSRGRLHDALELPGLVAGIGEERTGLLTRSVEGDECEVVTLNSLVERRGVGRALLAAVADEAVALDCRRIWLVTTNDNLPALSFYQRLGWNLVALHRGAMEAARQLKPEIPQVGLDGIALRHELELELPPPGAECGSAYGDRPRVRHPERELLQPRRDVHRPVPGWDSEDLLRTVDQIADRQPEEATASGGKAVCARATIVTVRALSVRYRTSRQSKSLSDASLAG